jgi:hypothetical protein
VSGSPRFTLTLKATGPTFTDPDRLAATVIVELDGIFIGEFMLRMEDA